MRPGFAATHINMLISTALTADCWQKHHFWLEIMGSWIQSVRFKRSACAKESISSPKKKRFLKKELQQDANWKLVNMSFFFFLIIQNVSSLYISQKINVQQSRLVAIGMRINLRQSLGFKRNVRQTAWFLFFSLFRQHSSAEFSMQDSIMWNTWTNNISQPIIRRLGNHWQTN